MATAVATIRVQRGARQLKTSLAELDSSLATLARHALALELARQQVEAKRDDILRALAPPRPRESVAEVVI